jgi:hypothetical protein
MPRSTRLTDGDADLAVLARDLRLRGSEAAERATSIYRDTLRGSAHLDGGNFTRIGTSDLRRLFDLYDARYFDGRLRTAVREQAAGPLGFRLSKRMTSVGGTTTCFRRRVEAPDGRHRYQIRFEIAISSTLLFQTFGDIGRPIRVSGLECRDRLEALQRVFEHELLHLLEMLAWGRSSCSRPRFARLARAIFAHRGVKHELVTPRERAYAQMQLRVGDRVEFDYEEQVVVGVVNRITRRATVLVEHPRGTRYSDGRRYLKYYIPLAMLRRRER